MPPKARKGPLVFLDACCLINLLATDKLEEILRLLPFRFATSRLIAETEVVAVGRESGLSKSQEIKSSAILGELEDLELLDLSTEEELGEFVRFAIELDDGEASICALALAKGGGLATDDRKALRIFHREAPQALTIQTPELLYEWARLSQATHADIKRVLMAVRRRASFYPRKDAFRSDWWLRFD
jgi:hypothetical protein